MSVFIHSVFAGSYRLQYCNSVNATAISKLYQPHKFKRHVYVRNVVTHTAHFNITLVSSIWQQLVFVGNIDNNLSSNNSYNTRSTSAVTLIMGTTPSQPTSISSTVTQTTTLIIIDMTPIPSLPATLARGMRYKKGKCVCLMQRNAS